MLSGNSVLSVALAIVSLISIACANVAFAGSVTDDFAYRCTDMKGTLLEYSPDINPFDRAGKELDEIAGRAIGRDKLLGKREFVYAGAATYLIRYPILEKGEQVAGHMTLDIRTREIVDGKLLENDLYQNSCPAPQKSEYSCHIIEGIPVFPYFITEGATATAALIAYWNQRKSLNLADCRDRAKLVISMTEAGCGCKLDQLLTRYMAAKGHKVQTRRFVWPVVEYMDTPLTFEAFKGEIDAGHPGILVVASHGLKRILPVCGYYINIYGCYVVIREQGYRGEQNPPESYLFINWRNLCGKLEFTSMGFPDKAD
ncbi:MAG: hypothetical protein PHT33_14425 [bacterium]|nr:hypothetical protein [bacterium]